MFNLLNERTSAFTHSLWDRYEMLQLLATSRAAREADVASLRQLGYSTVQDAYYCLQGNQPKADTALTGFWQQATQIDAFAGLSRLFQDGGLAGKQEAVLELARAAGKCLQPDPNAKDANPDDGQRVEEAQDLPEGDGQPAVVVARRAQFQFSDERPTERTRGIEALCSFLDGRPADKLEVATQLAQAQTLDVKALAHMLGWATKVVSGASRKGRAASGEFTGYRLNHWSDRVRPDEMLGVADGNLGDMAKLAEGSLTNREYAQRKPLGKGPVILLRDESSSMTEQPAQLQPSRSFEVALAHAFNQDHRDLISIAWSTRGIRTHTYGEAGLTQHLRAFLSGTTRIDAALTKALGMAQSYVAGADILIVTDGQLHSNPAETPAEFTARMTKQLAQFRERGGRVWMVVLGQIDDNSLRQTSGWTDGWVRIDRLGTGHELTDLLTSVATRPVGSGSRQLL